MLEARGAPRLPALPALYAVVDHPMQIDLAVRELRPVPAGLSFDALAPDDGYVCHLLNADDAADGLYLPRAAWAGMPRHGDVIVFHRPRPLGGGGQGGSNPLRALLQIALIVALPNLAPFLKLNGFLLGVGSAAITAGGAVLGSLLINALVPLDVSNRPGGGGGPQQYSVGLRANRPRLEQPIPELFGHNDTAPDYACPPYYLYEGNEQFLHAVLCVGRGRYEPATLRALVVNSPLDSFDDLQYLWVGPGQDVETLAGQTLVQTNIVTVPESNGVEMVPGAGCGPFAATRPEFACVGLGVDLLLPRGLDAGRSIEWTVSVQPIDDFEGATGPLTVLATEAYSTASVVPVRLSYDYTLAAGRYMVTVLRTDPRTADEAAAHDVTLAAVRATLDVPGVEFDDATYLVLRLRASGQLSGEQAIIVHSNRMLPVYDGAAWTSPQVTRNPADALAYLLRDARGLDDDEIDLEQLHVLRQLWAARQDRFDAVFDARSSCWEAAAMMARVGRAVPLVRAGKYTFWRDAPETAVVAAFGTRSMREFTITQQMPEPDETDAIELEYRDHRRRDWVTVTAQFSGGVFHTWRGRAERITLGLAVPASPLRVRMPGIVGEHQARRTAAYMLADGLLRRRRCEFTTELDGLLPAYGALVVVQHDVGDFGQGGDVVTWDDGTLALQTSEPLAWVAGAAHYVRLVRPTGALTLPVLCAPGGDDHEMLLDAGSHAAAAAACAGDGLGAFEVVVDDADRERTRYVFGDADRVGALAKVRAIVPRGEREIALATLLEDDRVHDADAPWRAGVDEQDPLGGGPGSVPPTTTSHVVRLTSAAYLDVAWVGSPDGAGLTLVFHNDGRFVIERAVLPFDATPLSEWIYPQTVSEVVAAGYEIHVEHGPEHVGDVLPTPTGDTQGTWLSLGTTRTFGWQLAPGDGQFKRIYVWVSIRDATSQVVQAARTLVLELQSLESGGT